MTRSSRFAPARGCEHQRLARRGGASHLSLLVQRNLAQRKHTPPSRPVRCTGFAEPAGFSEGASCPCGKRCTSMCSALRVWSAGSSATVGAREGKSRRERTRTEEGKRVSERVDLCGALILKKK